MIRKHTSKWLLLPLALIASVIAPLAVAQETTAGIQGVVRDATGGTVAGATVEVTGPSLIGNRRVQTDEGGNYRIAALPPGTYTMTVSAKGFRSSRQGNLDLSVGRMPNLDVKLEVGAVAETVEVSGEAPLVDTTQSKVAVTMQHETIDNLPKGRSFQSIIPFAPGARGEPLQSGSSSGTVSGGFQIDGASDSENVYMVDGVNITNIQNGGVGKDFQMDFVQEVQVKTSSFEAEYGGALGGVINVVPMKGSNAWHGTLVSYFRSNGMNANNGDRGLRTNPATSLSTANRLDATPEYFNAKKDYNTIIEPGYTVGGPAWKNKLWLFSSYIPSINTTRRLTNFTGANPGPRTLSASARRRRPSSRAALPPRR